MPKTLRVQQRPHYYSMYHGYVLNVLIAWPAEIGGVYGAQRARLLLHALPRRLLRPHHVALPFFLVATPGLYILYLAI